MAQLTAKPAGGKWNSASTWEPEQVPTAADDCILNSASGNITIELEAKCRSLNCTGYTGTLTQSNVTLKIGDATAGEGNIALKFVAGMTYSPGAGAANITFLSTSATEQTIDFAGKITRQVAWEANGKWKMVGSHSSTAVVKTTTGYVDFNGQTLNWSRFESTIAATRTIKIDNCTIVLSGSSASVPIWNLNTEKLTFSASGSTLTISDTSATEKKLTLGGATYGTIKIEPGGTGPVKLGLTSNNTIKRLEVVGGPKTIVLGSGKTQTVEELFATGSAGNLITIEASESGVRSILKKTTGTVSLDYLKLKDSEVGGGAEWFAGGHSENVSNNSGWVFSAPESAPSVGVPAASATLAYTLEENSVDPNGAATEAWFEWGATEAYGAKTAVQSLGSGHGSVAMTPVLISGLTLGQTYHYRAVAKNAKGETKGVDRTFTPTGSGSLSLVL